MPQDTESNLGNLFALLASLSKALRMNEVTQLLGAQQVPFASIEMSQLRKDLPVPTVVVNCANGLCVQIVNNSEFSGMYPDDIPPTINGGAFTLYAMNHDKQGLVDAFHDRRSLRRHPYSEIVRSSVVFCNQDAIAARVAQVSAFIAKTAIENKDPAPAGVDTEGAAIEMT